jgi:hypothetical protein
MAQSYVFPGNNNTYVPTLHSELIVEFTRNPASFPILSYINVRKVDKQRGYYIRMLNDNQGRYNNDSDSIWPDGNDAPVSLSSNDEFTYPPFECFRRNYSKRYGYLACDQGAWDVLDQGARMLAMDGMTARSRRLHVTLTTGANWGANSSTATALGGGVWSAATSVLPFIRSTIMQAGINIQKATYSDVQLKDLYCVINPNTAKVIATSAEYIDFMKQSPVNLPIWMGQEQFSKYNIPTSLFGVNMIVDDTVYNSAIPGAPAVFAFSLPDNTALLLSKKQGIQPSAGGSFSTVEMFTYQDMEPFVYNDVKNRRYDLQLVENCDTSVNVIVAPQSGYLIATNT